MRTDPREESGSPPSEEMDDILDSSRDAEFQGEDEESEDDRCDRVSRN